MASTQALTEALARRSHSNTGFRTPELAGQIATRRWRHEPYEDAGTGEWIDPRTLTIAVNDILGVRDGSLLVSDDWNGAIYRISYEG